MTRFKEFFELVFVPAMMQKKGSTVRGGSKTGTPTYGGNAADAPVGVIGCTWQSTLLTPAYITSCFSAGRPLEQQRPPVSRAL